jgi:hypothetical protein
MTALSASQKTTDLIHNPRVSILVHEWVEPRPTALASTTGPSQQPPRQFSLSGALSRLNYLATSSKSVELNGTATLLESGSEEERWCRRKHIEHNTFGASSGGGDFVRGNSTEDGHGGAGYYIENPDIRVIVVKIEKARTTDLDGTVRTWTLNDSGPGGPVNGVLAH